MRCLPLLLFMLLLSLSACRDKPRFERLSSAKTGITFANTLTQTDSTNVLDFEYVYNGGGVGVGDVNGDGLVDVFFSGNQVPCRLYLNRTEPGRGNFRFEDVTQRAGIAHRDWSTGVSLVDINADGRLDIYVCTISPKRGTGAPNRLYLNEGNDPGGVPRFRDVAAEVGLADTGYSTQAAFLDYDRDGDLDCYVLTNALESYNRNQPRGPVTDGSGRSTDRLYRNDSPRSGSGLTFTDVSREAGITTEGWGLGVAVSDINQDGWPDIYCANDFQSNDLLWINNAGRPGQPAFSNRITDYVQHQSYNAMGVDVADLNNDGWQELMTLDMMPEDNRRQKSMFGPQNPDRFQMGLDRGYQPQYVRNVLQLNRGRDARGQISFSEIGQLAGVYATDWSWSTLMADFDNDGWRDMLVTNGYPKDITDLDFVAYNNQYQANYFASDSKTDEETREKMDELIGVKKSNFLFRNRGGNVPTFSDVTDDWGLRVPSFSNGAAYADFDNDGDLDLVVNNINDEAFVYRNRTVEQREPNAGHFLRVTLRGTGHNPAALGATVSLHYCRPGGQRSTQLAEQAPYRGYKSSVDPTLHFGLGNVPTVDTLRVRWPDGRISQLTNVVANQTLIIEQREAGNVVAPAPPNVVNPATTLLTALTGAANPLPFVHAENPFIDFKEQVLLPHQYSRNGPGLAVGDVDQNGLDDVFVGGSSAHRATTLPVAGTLFLQLAPGRFGRRAIDPPTTRRLADDMGALFFDADRDGDQDLYVVSGGNEWAANQPYYQDRLYVNDGRGNLREAAETALPDTRASGSCVVAADYDRDGDLDLFVGGRVEPRRYPLPARSYILRNDTPRPQKARLTAESRVRFTDVTNQVAPGLASIGMVTAALWSDFDNDGRVDLVVAGEFMPITFFRNLTGTSLAQVPGRAVAQQSGWWNSLAAGDFDHDGDMDYVAGNLGLNSRYRASAAEPISVYAKDYDQNGTLDPIFCHYVQGKPCVAHPRDQLAEQIPALKRKFTTYAAYGRMTFDDMLGADELAGAYVARANWMASSYLENQGGGRFAIRPLPMEAQLSPVNGLLTDDFDGDGHADVLLAGNFYATDTQVGRYDAGKGLLLRGDGRGHFRPTTLAKSGFCANRDARSLAQVATSAGASLVLVGNNADTLQVFRRAPLRSGRGHEQLPLRPDDYAVETRDANGRKTRHELHYGSGYLAQSSRRHCVPAGATAVVTNFRGQRRHVVAPVARPIAKNNVVASRRRPF